jgi:hypothetical protein
VRIVASPASRRAQQDRRHLARLGRRSGRRLRRHEGRARPGRGAGAPRREDRHRALRPRSGALRHATRSSRPRSTRSSSTRATTAWSSSCPTRSSASRSAARARTCASRRSSPGWKLDIISESKFRQMEEEAKWPRDQACACSEAGAARVHGERAGHPRCREAGELERRVMVADETRASTVQDRRAQRRARTCVGCGKSAPLSTVRSASSRLERVASGEAEEEILVRLVVSPEGKSRSTLAMGATGEERTCIPRRAASRRGRAGS